MKKAYFAKECNFGQQKRRENKETTEIEETEESDTDTLTKIITEIKDVTDCKDHITLTILNDGSERKFIVVTGSTVTKLTSDKKNKIQENITDKKNYPDVNKNDVKFNGKITIEVESRRIKNTNGYYRTRRHKAITMYGLPTRI